MGALPEPPGQRSSSKQETTAQVDSVYIITSTLMINLMSRIVAYADERRLPLIGGWGAWASGGGLMSYGPDVNVMVRRTAAYVDRILKGAQPSELPVERPWWKTVTRIRAPTPTRSQETSRRQSPNRAMQGASVTPQLRDAAKRRQLRMFAVPRPYPIRCTGLGLPRTTPCSAAQ
ncbi:hypothetical protein IVA79_18235 [Bradyrhizobium sp. 138]|nr:hypothetical protein [Bradyrhizobium sp. 138]